MSVPSSLLYIITVGFHHRRGSIVELAYPSFVVDDVESSDNSGLKLPSKWKILASFALPDGAHNFLKDTVYFTLPSLDNDEAAVFGIAAYRQIDSSTISQPTPEITRTTVQKSLVVLSRFPLFGFVAHHLSNLADSLFDGGGFTLERLTDGFYKLTEICDAVVAQPVLYRDALYFNLNAANFVRVYGRDALVLFKTLLLERRVLFTGESAGWMGNWIVTLLSLFPELLDGGLCRSSFVDRTWLGDMSCWPAYIKSFDMPKSVFARKVDTNASDLVANVRSASSSGVCSSIPRNLNQSTSDISSGSTRPLTRSCSDVQVVPVDFVYSSSTCMPRSQPALDSLITESTGLMGNTNTIPHSSKVNDSNQRIFPDQNMHTNAPFNSSASLCTTDSWGFPLSLFAKSYILPIYSPLGILDTLMEPLVASDICFRDGIRSVSDRSVRAFLSGATNPLLRTHKQLAEVIVSTLSPVDGLPDPGNHDLGASTSVFETTGRLFVPLKSITSDDPIPLTSPSGVRVMVPGPGKPTGVPKRTASAVSVCSTVLSSGGTRVRTRSIPSSLTNALQLSRLDRLFIDHLQAMIIQWFEARAELQRIAGLPSSFDLSILHSQDENSIEKHLNDLTSVQKTMLLRFPSSTIFDAYVRRQFTNYLRALLLTADGYGENPGDFNGTYVSCLRTSRCFLIWRKRFEPDKVFVISDPVPLLPVEQENSSTDYIDLLNASQSQSDSASTDHSSSSQSVQIVRPSVRMSLSTPTASIAIMFAQHPGRRFLETDDWEQITVGVRRFRDMAADRGRRLMTQGAQGLAKLSTDINASWRATANSSVMSKVSDAFRSLMNISAPPTTDC